MRILLNTDVVVLTEPRWVTDLGGVSESAKRSQRLLRSGGLGQGGDSAAESGQAGS